MMWSAPPQNFIRMKISSHPTQKEHDQRRCVNGDTPLDLHNPDWKTQIIIYLPHNWPEVKRIMDFITSLISNHRKDFVTTLHRWSFFWLDWMKSWIQSYEAVFFWMNFFALACRLRFPRCFALFRSNETGGSILSCVDAWGYTAHTEAVLIFDRFWVFW